MAEVRNDLVKFTISLNLPRSEFYVCYGLAWINARCPPKPLYHSPYSAGHGRENMMKGSWIEIRTGRDHSATTITDKRD